MTGKKPIQTEASEETSHGRPPAPKRRWRWALNLVICLGIIAAGILGANYIKRSAPKAHRRPPAKVVPLVVAEAVSPATHQVLLSAAGTVIPAREVILKSRVAGQVLEINPGFIEGSHIKEGEEILKIDPEDYNLAIARKKSAIANAQYALKLEMGYQDVAKREWQLLKGDKPADKQDIELALRKPHLAKARADLAAARAELKQARLELARTTVKAPFNAFVRSKSVEVGSQVSTQDRLAELVGTDVYWIRVSIPVAQLKWIHLPRAAGDPGSEVRVVYRNGAERRGSVIKLLGDLELEGRMARILVSVDDPLDIKSTANGRPPLLIGEYVRVEIKGELLENVYRIQRSALRDNTSIWLLDKDNRLEIRTVQTLLRGTDTVVLGQGLQKGERLIVSDLAKPVNGMPLRLEQAAPESGRSNVKYRESPNKGQ